MSNEGKLRQEYTKCHDYKKVFSSEEGQTVLYDLMGRSNFLMPTHVPNDPHASDRNEGMRELFLYIIYQVEANPSEILETIRIQKEQVKKDRGNIYANID